jgi:hypothetical protein
MSAHGSVIASQERAARRLQVERRRLPQLYRIGGGLAVFVVVVFAAYAFAVRPWHLRWGATAEEVAMPLPGDELVRNAADMRTRAVTIRASASDVFPWLLQLGWERGGLYSYDWLENLMGLGFANADRVHLEWQNTQAGDLVSMGPPGKSPVPYTVAQIIPNRAFVAGHRTDDGSGWVDSWQFVLNPVDAQTTRLLLRSRSAFVDQTMRALMTAIEPGVFIMERGMLLGIKERAEKAK